MHCRKFSLDDLLTNVMIYWTSGCIISSMRFYKENFGKGLDQPHSKWVTNSVRVKRNIYRQLFLCTLNFLTHHHLFPGYQCTSPLGLPASPTSWCTHPSCGSNRNTLNSQPTRPWQEAAILLPWKSPCWWLRTSRTSWRQWRRRSREWTEHLNEKENE